MWRALIAMMVPVVWDGTARADVAVKQGHVPKHDLPLDPVVSLGAGVDGFIGGRARETFGVGPSWNLRVGLFDTQNVRLEVVYNGSSQPVSGQDSRWLVAHGLLGLLRINFAPGYELEPFIYAGGGWVRFHAADAMIEGLRSPDHVLEIPFGIGVARRFGRVVFDARVGVSVMSGADLLQRPPTSSTTGGETLHRFGLRANIGIEL